MPNIRHELIIGATPEKVYNAVISQEGLSAWWTPEARAKAELDTVARFPFGPAYFKEMKIAELTPTERVRWICISGANEWIGTTLSFTFEAGDKSTMLKSHPETGDQLRQNSNSNVTLLILHHDGWKEYSSMYAECNYTWGQFLRSLKLFCETGKGRPWPEQHRM